MTISQAKAAMFGKIAYELFEEELLKMVERYIDEFDRSEIGTPTKDLPKRSFLKGVK